MEDNFSYFFEPLHSLRSDIRWKNQVAPNTEYINNFLRNLFNCEESGIRKFRKDKFILKKSKNVFCSKDSNVLIKAIRLTSDHIAELLHRQRQNNLPDLKIIHLVRWKSLTLHLEISPSPNIPFQRSPSNSILNVGFTESLESQLARWR